MERVSIFAAVFFFLFPYSTE